jgi:hypothetical protein
LTRKAKRSSAANHDGSGLLGSVFGRGAFATRGASSDTNWRGAPSHALGGLALLAMLASLVVVAFPAGAQAANPYLPGRSLDGSTTPATTFEDVTGDAVDSKGDIYAADFSNEVIDVFDPSGAYLTEIAATEPISLAVDSEGNVYTAEYGSGNVVMYSPEGGVYPPVSGTSYTGPTTIDGTGTAFSVAVDPSNDHLWSAASTPKKSSSTTPPLTARLRSAVPRGLPKRPDRSSASTSTAPTTTFMSAPNPSRPRGRSRSSTGPPER